jgi:hypothetical protein
MGLHVFFGCYFNLFRLMAKCGVLENLLLKEHTHTFCNNDGDVRELDFRFFVNGTKIGAPFHGANGGGAGGQVGGGKQGHSMPVTWNDTEVRGMSFLAKAHGLPGYWSSSIRTPCISCRHLRATLLSVGVFVCVSLCVFLPPPPPPFFTP